MNSENTIAQQLLEFLQNSTSTDSDVLAENLVEFLTNTVNMTSVFYDIFLNPEPMVVELQQFNDDNELVTIPVQNRALDRQNMIKRGNGSPEGQVQAVIGTMYVDMSNSYFYCKTGGSQSTSDTHGWTLLPTKEFVGFIIQSYLTNGGYITMQDVANYLTSNNYVTQDILNGYVTPTYLVDNNYITSNNIAGTNNYGVVKIDGDTIALNNDGQISVDGTKLTGVEVTSAPLADKAETIIDTNDSSNPKKIWTGSESAHEALESANSIDSNTIYFVFEDNAVVVPPLTENPSD